ncbi:hypothetical protein C499_16697 [Halogeometricum borinquense DSM 11551]|uniref:Uncharacterized protein n=2 Tax=Halogeometricum borinquense TaxID=60847 RepID=E4NQW2_HALBP|nr:HTH domain-containing protein [Halogeometricum borinquense]ADQ67909.1 hypothetical protein Hbor_23490 [Halogeometricum borinquense DSM 11551]ELY24171.1 hypothetical protein C499_16697 [Halogeometricum borinquense DSM 11551]RYJ08524.1 hypothetical protein ELS19_18620 [Halogeometricum borinquense]
MLAHTTSEPANQDQTEDETKRQETPDKSGMRVELWREPTQTGGQNEFDRVAERLRTLEERGVVDAAAVETWERFVDVSGGYPEDDVPRATLDRLGRLQRWAWQHGRSVSLPTESRTVGRGRLGPPAELRRVPRAALVEFENGTMTNVTIADERTGCLTERLETLAERERAATEDEDREKSLERLSY